MGALHPPPLHRPSCPCAECHNVLGGQPSVTLHHIQYPTTNPMLRDGGAGLGWARALPQLTAMYDDY